MASGGSAKNSGQKKFLDSLPYETYKKLCRVLDMNSSWEELGGKYMKFGMSELHEFRRAIYQEFNSGSPTQLMLTRWGYKNGTIDRLYRYLAEMKHILGMTILYPYVSPRLQVLLDSNQTEFSSFFKSDEKSFSSREPTEQSCPFSVVPSTRHELVKPFQGATAYTTNNSMNYEKDFYNVKTAPNCQGESQLSCSKISYRKNSQSTEKQIKIPNEQDFSFSSTKDFSVYKYKESVANEQTEEKSSINSLKEEKGGSKKLNVPLQKSSIRIDGSGRASFASDAQQLVSFPKISFEEIQNCTNNFQSDILGRGGFGTVYAGTWKHTRVAIKLIVKKENPGLSCSDDVKIQRSLAEVLTLESVRHPNIITLYGFCLTDQSLCLMYQYMPNGSLEDKLHRRMNEHSLTWFQRYKILLGTAAGIQFLHTLYQGRPLIHGDIKSANILLDENLQAKIGDFGLVQEGPPNEQTHISVPYIQGTRAYLPVEYLKNNKLSTKVDTYSFGVVLFEVATGLRALDHSRKRETKNLVFFLRGYDSNKIFSLRDLKAGVENHHFFERFLQLGWQCTEDERNKRPEMVAVFKTLERLQDNNESKNANRKLSNSTQKHVTPMEIQQFYDNQKNAANKKTSNESGKSGSSADDVKESKKDVNNRREDKPESQSSMSEENQDQDFDLLPHLTELGIKEKNSNSTVSSKSGATKISLSAKGKSLNLK